MVAGCGNNMLKYILLFLNFLIFSLSLAGVIGSLVFIFKPGTLDDAGKLISEVDDLKSILSPGTIRAGLYVILGASVVILIISFLGCCGAWKEVRFLLGLYAAIMLIILVAEIAAFVVTIVYQNKVKSGLKSALEKAKKINETMYKDFENALKCCGVNDGDDCVKLKPKPGTPITTSKPVGIGCYNKILDLLKGAFTIVLAVSVITVVIEVFLISFSCCLCSSIGEKIA